MRKILILITVLMIATIPANAAEGWTQNQTTANQIANLARGMGLQETNPIIQEAAGFGGQKNKRSRRGRKPKDRLSLMLTIPMR